MKRFIQYKFWLLLVLSIAFIAPTLRAQQDPLFTHYITNRLLVNPAYAGSDGLIKASALYRTQWVDIEGAPDTYTVSGHLSILGDILGLGLYYQQDEIGPSIKKEVVSNYAFHIPMGSRKLSFGLAFGMKHMSIDWTQLILTDPNEPAFQDPPGSSWKPTFNVGVHYQTPSFFIGASSKELLNSEYFAIDDNINFTSHKTFQHLYLMGGFFFPMSEGLRLRPSSLVKWVEAAPLEVDVTLMADFSDRFSLGAAYRTTSAISGLVQIGITRNMKIGYSYDHYFNELNWVNTGSHEIMIEFRSELFNEKLKTPRFF